MGSTLKPWDTSVLSSSSDAVEVRLVSVDSGKAHKSNAGKRAEQYFHQLARNLAVELETARQGYGGN
jgi:hypothetical protein